jgi:hypothetical protein
MRIGSLDSVTSISQEKGLMVLLTTKYINTKDFSKDLVGTHKYFVRVEMPGLELTNWLYGIIRSFSPEVKFKVRLLMNLNIIYKLLILCQPLVLPLSRSTFKISAVV